MPICASRTKASKENCCLPSVTSSSAVCPLFRGNTRPTSTFVASVTTIPFWVNIFDRGSGRADCRRSQWFAMLLVVACDINSWWSHAT